MSQLDPLLDRNPAFAATGAHKDLQTMPRHQTLLVTCMDPRVDPAAFFRLELGDAPVLRNAGGRVTRDVIEEVAFVGHVTKTMFGDGAPRFEVCVIQHTGCGSGMFANAEFSRGYAELIDANATEVAGRAVTDPDVTVRGDVELLRRSPLLPSNATVSGHVYDVDTGLVRTVVPIDG